MHSPFFDDWYFPEADLLRIYSLFLMCKFPEASKEINAFQDHYKPIQQRLAALGASMVMTDFPERFLDER